MYAKDTILELIDQRPPEIVEGPNDPETGEPTEQEIEFPYNRVKVIGISPIDHGIHKGDWGSGGGAGVIIAPAGDGFGANLDEPVGKLEALYKVVSVPEPVELVPHNRGIPYPNRMIDGTSAEAGDTPEDVFAKEAPGVAPEDGLKRARTPMPGVSPLPDVRQKVLGSSSPLDSPLGGKPAAKKAAPKKTA